VKIGPSESDFTKELIIIKSDSIQKTIIKNTEPSNQIMPTEKLIDAPASTHMPEIRIIYQFNQELGGASDKLKQCRLNQNANI